MPNPPVVETIGEDPLLADSKIIAEAWDAGGAYQVGTFGSLRWAEWNGRYRDDVRRFWRGDPHMIGPHGHAAGRFQRPLPGQRPAALSQHQFHHLARRLHAQRPGELQLTSTTRPTARGTATATTTITATTTASKGPPRGGRSRPCGSGRSRTCWRRLLSQGVPMLDFGDECRRTQQGNNNAYCQDNAISWFDWRLVAERDRCSASCRPWSTSAARSRRCGGPTSLRASRSVREACRT